MKNKKQNKLATPLSAVIVLMALLVCYLLFSPVLSAAESRYVYIDNDDNIDSVYTKLGSVASGHAMIGFRTLAALSSYSGNIRSGRYGMEKGDGVLTVFRKMKNGMQVPVSLTIPAVRTVDRLAGTIAGKLMIDSAALCKALTDTATCARYGYTPETIVCMFIPDTYEVYWNISLEKFLDKMDNESKKFWDFEKIRKAKAMNLSKEEVMTLASIVDEETANDGEKPVIAGMYYNRLKAGMPLQADPTIKFALKDFDIRRIYLNMLNVKSPYNTYVNTGLPPGPIRMPSVAGINAVLDHVKHDYLYMCAKEDFSGTHNFASTYREHLDNAAKYSMALDKRGIK